MKAKCDFCDATAIGSRDELALQGWVRAMFSAPKRITVTACPQHQREFSERVNEIFTSAKVGGTRTHTFDIMHDK